MVRLINDLGDRMLGYLVPKAEASACQCSGGYWDCRCYGGTAEKRWCSENCNCVSSCGDWYVGDCPNGPICP